MASSARLDALGGVVAIGEVVELPTVVVILFSLECFSDGFRLRFRIELRRESAHWRADDDWRAGGLGDSDDSFALPRVGGWYTVDTSAIQRPFRCVGRSVDNRSELDGIGGYPGGARAQNLTIALDHVRWQYGPRRTAPDAPSTELGIVRTFALPRV